MHAIRVHGPTGPISYEQVRTPSPAPGEVLVAVRAVGLTAGELTWPEAWPVTPGHEISGEVAARGEGVTGLAVGQQVYALVGFDRDGGAAEYVAVPAADVAAKPVQVDHQGAASLALAGLTAWQALVDHAKLTAGQHVLVHGGAGGVGNYTVQLAAAMGATVTATAAARDTAFVAGLGAREVIDYAGPPVEERDRDVDVVVDTVGGDTLVRSLRVLRPGGLLIGIASAPPQEEADERGVRGIYFVVEPSGSELAELARLVDSGLLRANVGRVFPLAAAGAAFDAVDRGHVRGKVVLDVWPTAPTPGIAPAGAAAPAGQRRGRRDHGTPAGRL